MGCGGLAAAVTRQCRGPIEAAPHCSREALRKRRDTQTRTQTEEKQLTAATAKRPQIPLRAALPKPSESSGGRYAVSGGSQKADRVLLGTTPPPPKPGGWNGIRQEGGGFSYTPFFLLDFSLSRWLYPRPPLTHPSAGRTQIFDRPRPEAASERKARTAPAPERGGAGLRAVSSVIGWTGHGAGYDWSVRKAGAGAAGGGRAGADPVHSVGYGFCASVAAVRGPRTDSSGPDRQQQPSARTGPRSVRETSNRVTRLGLFSLKSRRPRGEFMAMYSFLLRGRRGAGGDL